VKTIKAIGLPVRLAGGLLAIALLAVLALSGTAEAFIKNSDGTVTVEKKDTLWKLSLMTWGTGTFWTEIAKANDIANPKKLPVGKKLIIPEVGTIKITQHNTAPYGAKGLKGDKKVLEAIEKTGYPEEVKKLLSETVTTKTPSPYLIIKGEKVDCTSNKYGVFCNPVRFEYNWKDRETLSAMFWRAETEEWLCFVRVINDCGNFDSVCWKSPPTPKVEVPEEIQPPPVEIKKPEKIPEVKIPEKVVEIVPPIKEVAPVPEITIPEISPIEEKWAIEHEPIVGGYAWDNKLAHGWGGYGEYMAWLRKAYPWGYANGWSFGLGIYGAYSEGDTETLPHYWWLEKIWAVQAGAKFIGETNRGQPWQVQLKVRYGKEYMHGENTAGYEMSQVNDKIGFYTEALERINPKWIIGATAEGWYALSRDMDSTWSGDKPSNRTTLALNALAQYKINEDWQVRGAAGPFYQGWDKLWGLRALAEMRYKETIMAGPQIAIFPFGLSSVYDGVSASDLTTLTGFVRVELGAPIRNWDRNVRMEKIRKLDEEKYGPIVEEER
jgi:hypothetical protein